MTAVLYWRETTDALPFETGIQRVTRRLAEGLTRCGVEPIPVGWDGPRRLMRGVPADKPGRPRAQAMSEPEACDGVAWLLLPEIPLAALSDDLDPVQLAHAYGFHSAAVVHDLIPIRLAHLYGSQDQALYRRYYQLFSTADLVLATTDLVADHLRDHLAGEGLRVPPVAVVPLPAQFADLPRVRPDPPQRAAGSPLRLLAVSTWEPRKNLPGLLRGLRRARERSAARIDVTLVGRRGLHPDHDDVMDALLAELPGSVARSRMGDAELAALYATHDASVYPSCEEGFGLPVLESLWLGRPCLCHAGSAMAEVAPGGGTIMVDMGDEDAVAEALVHLHDEPEVLVRLTAEAQARPLRSWDDYAAEVVRQLEGSGRA